MATPTIDKDRETYVVTRDPRTYVTDDVWDREVTLLMRDYPFDRVMAERLFAGAVSYLITAMERWGQGLEMCCGRIVDIAVHTFILDTRNYREFCAKWFDGRFLEHIPEIAFKYDGSVERTAHIIADNGFAVDWPLWEADFAKCGPCSPGSNCH
jgi:hypothetical protein